MTPTITITAIITLKLIPPTKTIKITITVTMFPIPPV